MLKMLNYGIDEYNVDEVIDMDLESRLMSKERNNFTFSLFQR